MKKVLFAILVLSLIGLVLASYLAYSAPDSSAVCDTACNSVTNSQYKTMLGVPVASLGLLGFIGLAGLSGIGLFAHKSKRHIFSKSVFLLSSCGLAFVAYLVYIEIAKMHSVCLLCTASHFLGLAIWGLALLAVVKK